tara:strand:+ start:1798 stop:2166 length:369 start_codon:yes stop_codon:yes gene_type:complete
MIHYGSRGDMSLFYDGKFIVSRPLTNDRGPSYHFEKAESLLVDGLKGGKSLLDLRKRFKRFMERFSKETKYWRDIELQSSLDRDMIFYTGLMLIKLQVIDPDGDREGILISKPKKGILVRPL